MSEKKRRSDARKKVREILGTRRRGRSLPSREDLEYQHGLTREQADTIFKVMVEAGPHDVGDYYANVDRDAMFEILIDDIERNHIRIKP